MLNYGNLRLMAEIIGSTAELDYSNRLVSYFNDLMKVREEDLLL